MAGRRAAGTGGAGRSRAISCSRAWLLSVYFLLVWGLWVAGLVGLFWLAVLPRAAVGDRRHQAVQAVICFGPRSRAMAHPTTTSGPCTWTGACARSWSWGGLSLTYGWKIDLVELTSRDTLLVRLVRGALSNIIILLVADLIGWWLAQIDRRLSRAQDATSPAQRGGPEAGTAAHAADLPQCRLRGSGGRGRADGPLRLGCGSRASDRRRRHRGRRCRIRVADARQGCHQRDLLPARRPFGSASTSRAAATRETSSRWAFAP